MGVFSNLKPTNHANRNGFDLGRFSTFSTKAGYVNTVFNQLTLPSSEYSLDIKQLLRTQPLQKAAFTGFSINYDVIWCPLAHLYSGFNQFVAQREQKNHVTQPSNEYIPTFDLYTFVKQVYCMALYDYICSFAREFATSEDVQEDFQDNFLVLLREEHLPYDSVALQVVRNLDMMEYCNILPILKAHYAALYREYHNKSVTLDGVTRNIDMNSFYDSSTANTWGLKVAIPLMMGKDPSKDNLDVTEYSVGQIIYGLWNGPAGFLKPYGSDKDVKQLIAHLNPMQPTLWVPLSYNKAFYEYYRNTYYDEAINFICPFTHNSSIVMKNAYVRLFNLDDFTDGFFNSDEIDYDEGNAVTSSKFFRLLAIFCMKPHLYKRDLFTGVLPSTQFGDVSVMHADDVFSKLIGNVKDSNTTITPRMVYGSYADKLSPDFSRVNESVTSDYNSIVHSDKFKFDPAPMISVLEMRRADSMQRFKERMLRAGSRTKDIFKAHGWSDPLSEKSYEPIFLGSFDGRLDINVVAATNDSENVELAQLGANGMATIQGHKIHIKTSDFGILLVTMHIDKDAVYDSYGLSQQHTLVDPFDFPYPELQNISLAPIDKKYLNVFDPSDQRVVGFLPRAIYAKTAIDKVHGEFYSSLPWENTARTPYQISTGIPQADIRNVLTGSFSDWVAPREDILNFNTLSFLYISPLCTDTLFKYMFNVRQDSDNFVVNVRFDCYAVEPLPVIGLPI